VRPETISLVLGDTDRTPDGGASAGFVDAMANVRKVAAYTHQALVGLAATQLGVPVSKLTVADAIVSGGGKSISYGQLVQGQQLDLKIPVAGMRAKSIRPRPKAMACGTRRVHRDGEIPRPNQ